MSRAMKTSKIPFAPQIPETWREIPNRFLFLEHSSKVGELWKEYQLLSLTTSGVKEKNINDTGGKVPDSYDNYQTVEKGDMVFCLFDLDCSAVFSGLSTYDGMITSAYDVFRTNEEYLDNTYARFWFDYVFSRRYYKMFSKNIRYTITTDVFKSLYTPCPPIEEQKRIGALLNKKCGEIDEMVSLQEKIIEELKAYKQSIITEAVCKGLYPDVQMKDSGIEWIGKIPSHWYGCRLKNVVSLKTGTTPDGFDLQAEDTTIPWYTPTDISEDGNVIITSERTLNHSVVIEEGLSLFPAHSLLFVGIGASAGKIGYTLCEGYSNQQITALIPYNCVSKFIFYYLIADRKRLRDNAFYTTLPIINNTYLSQEKIVFPPIEEQQSIADYLDEKCQEIDALIAVKQSKIDALKEYKKSIIYEYITGKKEVQ